MFYFFVTLIYPDFLLMLAVLQSSYYHLMFCDESIII